MMGVSLPKMNRLLAKAIECAIRCGFDKVWGELGLAASGYHERACSWWR